MAFSAYDIPIHAIAKFRTEQVNIVPYVGMVVSNTTSSDPSLIPELSGAFFDVGVRGWLGDHRDPMFRFVVPLTELGVAFGGTDSYVHISVGIGLSDLARF